MFETVVPETFQVRSRKLLYETLPFSIVLHAVAFAIAIVAAAWNVAFPTHTPYLTSAYSLTKLPDPPPPPPPPPPKTSVPVAPVQHLAAAPPPPPPAQLLELAPRTIPSLVPVVEPPSPTPPPPPVPVTEASINGVAGGSPDGKVGGTLGGHGKSLAGSLVFPDDGRVYVERDAKLPLVAIDNTPPRFPDEAFKKHQEDSVLVRYVIGTNGRIKELMILDHAKNPVFDQATLDAISKWTWKPMVKNGKPVEVVHELTVFYQIVYR